MVALHRQLCSWRQPESLAQELINTWGEDGFIWLDGDNSELGRWITLAIDPIEQICCRGLPIEKHSSNPFKKLRDLKTGHWTGWLSYEAGAWIEPLNPWQSDDMATLWIGCHDPIFKFDLKKEQLWIEGCNEDRFKQFTKWLGILPKQYKNKISSKTNRAHRIPLQSWEWLTSKENYAHDVKQLKEFIESGDLFQANLATCCTTKFPEKTSVLELFSKLRKYCPSPFGGLIIGAGLAKEEAVMSVSPERFLKVLRNGDVETRPIKGTRPRNSNSKIDADMGIELITSLKDRAENIMVVDLLRNDLGRVCLNGSINVSQLVGLESFPQVHHLTSVINGCLRKDKSWVDLLEACWPGGSISGAPKLRACQRLNELEKVARGPYCGSLININWSGDFDSNILIRSLIKKDSKLKAYAGCGIVADSDPTNEAEEMTWKLLPLLKALE